MMMEQNEYEPLYKVAELRADIRRLSLELDRRDQIERVYVNQLRKRNEIIQAMKKLLLVYLASD